MNKEGFGVESLEKSSATDVGSVRYRLMSLFLYLCRKLNIRNNPVGGYILFLPPCVRIIIYNVSSTYMILGSAQIVKEKLLKW